MTTKKRQLTNIELPPDLKRQAKSKAALEGTNLTSVIIQLLTTYIK